ncbi:schlafen family member 5-like [Molossus molossus]|uniref:Schlafen family member 5 n=1 Tax=Molossus molossus TaxID=27622 RepID=A0A7J8D2B2_MOLMO|nr:schlafen family member 5-like [Molossus molossus]KAF6417205.1 schlafen family member 5 [Molossus molossus]
MSLKIDLETDFAECVLNAGKVILGCTQRNEMDPHLQEEQNQIILRAICALLNSGGGVVKIEIANKNYNYETHGVGLNVPSVFKHYLDEMQQKDKDLFFIFVKSWNARASGVRLATLSSNLYHRHQTSTDVMTSQEALAFLRRRIQTLQNIHDSNLLSPQNVQGGNINVSAAALFHSSDHLQYLQKLNFTKSEHVEFKRFSGEILQCFAKHLPSCVSAFANTEGGYIFWGVHEETLQVIGYKKEEIDCTSLEGFISSCIRKLPAHHFCTQRCEIKHKINLLEVHKQGVLYGYVCAIKVEQFCCALFAKEPSAWQVKNNCVRQLATNEWAAWMTETDPDLSRFPELVLELSLSSSTPCSRSVCTHKNSETLREQQRRYFPVSDSLEYRPQSLYKELCSQHIGLRNVMFRVKNTVPKGILIFSRSWAVDVGLQEKQGVICDALLLSQNKIPVLYTILSKRDEHWKDYSMTVARTLKQKLVNTGGYTGKLCIIPSAFLLEPGKTSDALYGLNLQKYPESYKLMTTQDMEALLQSLVIVLRGFRSFLSEELGSEVLNLLTDKQYELLSMNFRSTRELFVHGLPGSGKTVLALRIMEKIRNVFHCQPGEILYICENKPLQEFVSHKHICQAVTRRAFLQPNANFENIQHIIIDEAQNFRTENGDWYEKAKTITRRGRARPGILWIFIDYFQTSHMDCSGLPPLSEQQIREVLIKVVRNADPIANYLQEIMHEVRENPPPNIPVGSLNILNEVEMAHSVPGNLEIREYSDLERMVVYIAETCQMFLRNGYSYKDIAVLCSKAADIDTYKQNLQSAMRRRRNPQLNEESGPLVQIKDASEIKGNHIVLDSVRRFSGLERNIVFGISPRAAEPAVFHNLLLCLASRARKYLYILKVSN